MGAYFFNNGKKWVTPDDPMPTVLKNSSVGVNSVTMPATLRSGALDVDTAGTREQLSATSAALTSGVVIKAKLGNTGTIYVGDAAVAAGSGIELSIGQEVFVVIDNLNKIYIDASDSGDGVTFIGS